MSLRYMLDSNVCIHLLRHPESNLLARLDAHEGEICMSAVTWHELCTVRKDRVVPHISGTSWRTLPPG